MAMTPIEQKTRFALAKFLSRQGYPTYAKIFLKFELHFHRKKAFAAMIDTDKRIIYINPAIRDKEDLSVLLRHEILHYYLAHQERALVHYAKQHGKTWKDFDDITLEDLMNLSDEEVKNYPPEYKEERDLARELYTRKYTPDKKRISPMRYDNYLKDLEISNRGYTEADKELVKNLNVDGVSMHGLITDELQPGWEGKSLEQMMDAVEDQIKKENEEIQNDLDAGIIRGTFDPATGRFTDRKGKIYGKA